MQLYRKLFPVFLTVLMGCAQIVAPTGGEKDVTPPVALSIEPKNLSTNFTADKIVITFDEFIQLNNPGEQVLISPPMLKMPTFKLKQKSLVIEFEQELDENTTYTINFGEAIKDNNEGNTLKNFTYVFGTGARLDSMEVKGKLVDAITGEPVKEALVMLYKDAIDSLPLTTIPDYFTRTTEGGNFHIKHVANRPYKIFSLLDQNSNYKFDIPDEQIGFLDTLILPQAPPFIPPVDSLALDSIATDSIAQPDVQANYFYTIKMFVEADTTQFLKRAYCEHYGKLVFVYNRPVGKFSATIDGVSFKKQWAIKEFGVNRDTVVLWTTDVVPDTMLVLSRVDKFDADSTELVMKARTAEIKAKTNKKGRKSTAANTTFSLRLNTEPGNGRPPNPNRALKLIWSHPILSMNLKKVALREDSIRVKYEMTTTDTALRKFNLKYNWKKGAQYDLHIPDSSFSDLFGLRNDTINISFIGIDKEQFGEVSLNITAKPTQQLIIELLDGQSTVKGTKTCTGKGVIQFKQLDPAKYALRVSTDLNKNERWDSGRYAEHLQPEPIKIIQSEIEVRANWDMELEWDPKKEFPE